VLARKRDPLTQISFLEVVSSSTDGNMVNRFWQTLSAHLEQEFKASARCTSVLGLTCLEDLRIQYWSNNGYSLFIASQFLHQAFVDGFPRLLNLFHEFFSRVSVHTSTGASDDFQRYDGQCLANMNCTACYQNRLLTLVSLESV
jgi:hypothetical protein